MVNFTDIKENPAVHTYITAANDALGVIGYTEHGLAHATKVSGCAASVLKRYGGSEREVELARIAGYMHDIGNLVNREYHALTGATMAFQILTGMGMPPEEIAVVCAAIGNHDEGSGMAVNRASAALILADKSDVRRSRVRAPRQRGLPGGHPRPCQLRGDQVLAGGLRRPGRDLPQDHHRYLDLPGDRVLQDLFDAHVHVQGRVGIPGREVFPHDQQHGADVAH